MAEHHGQAIREDDPVAGEIGKRQHDTMYNIGQRDTSKEP